MDDIFCKIINKEINSEIVFENDDLIAINDIHPQAPVHILIISKKHLEDLISVEESDTELVGKLVLASKKIAEKLGLKENGYRLIINQGKDSGQLVPHLHIHLLGGKHLGAKIIND